MQHNKEKGMVTTGDFNFPDIEFDSLTNKDHKSPVFINFILNNFMIQVAYEHICHEKVFKFCIKN